jgi:hypothetical protein
MKIYKKILRFFVLSIFIVVASFGMMPIFPNFRDRYLNNEIKTEQIDRKENDSGTHKDVSKE